MQPADSNQEFNIEPLEQRVEIRLCGAGDRGGCTGNSGSGETGERF